MTGYRQKEWTARIFHKTAVYVCPNLLAALPHWYESNLKMRIPGEPGAFKTEKTAGEVSMVRLYLPRIRPPPGCREE